MGIYCIPSRLNHLHSHYNFPKCLRCGFLLILMVLVFPNSGLKLHDGYYNSLFGPIEDQPSRIKVESLGAVLKRHIQELRSTQNRQVDLVFLVDSSASVGPEDFRNEIKFVRKLLADFTVDHNTTRVAIVTFSSREKVVRHVDHLTQPTIHNHKCSLLMEEIPSIKYIGGGTYTLGAFLEAKQILRAARPDSMKAVILITDGFSNGGDPRPEARKLKSDGVKVFTFGIRNGNVRELYEMASEPRNETCYILNSFQEFEALARRALHSDLHMGTYIPQPPNMCSRLCTDDGLCCHGNASCMCGTHTGKYDCLCKPGHYGNGLGKDGCKLCPPGTYKNFTGAGDVSVCTPCPDENQITMPGATLIHECACKRGYRNFNSSECTVFRCPELFEPKNGYFVNSQCDNVFNAACGLRCRPGYELRGSSLRICQEDGSWSGQDTECVLKTCPALPVPKNGHMVCTTDDFSYPTVCRFTCQGGYQLLGSRKRSCLANALWTGIATRCREISCPPLPEIRDGAIQPSSCTEGEVRFGTTCQLSCLRGYKLRGPNTKQCTTDGTWSAASNEPNQCLDKTPPYIQCPENIQVAVDDDNDTVEVNWPVPVPVDNSGFLPVLTSDPAVAPPVRFPIDFITVTYKAEDLSHNVAKCKFYVLVIDETPPRVDKCKSPEPVVSSGSHGNVTWEEPLFTDNSGTPVEIIATHTPGLFPQGHTTVTYTAEDRHGNNSTCSLDIYVVPHPCQYPEAPANGKRECRESEEGVYCTLSCQPGFAFVETPPPEYFCAYNNIWTPADRLPFPDCAAQQISNEVLQPASITLSGDLSCTEHALLHRVEQNIEAKVNDKVTTLCEENVICEVDQIKVTCEENEDFNKIHSVGDLSNINVLPGIGRRHARSVGDTGHWLNYKSRASLKFDFMLEGTTNNTEDGEDLSVQQKKLSQSMTRLLSGLQAQAKQGHFDLYVGGRWLRFSDMDFDASRHTFSCPTGSVLLNNTCVNCPLGMFFHVMTSSCRSCPKGTYQPSEGQLACLVCPENTNTSSEHARNELECRAQCLPGSVSPTGLERCESCPEGFYQPSYAETACIACPEGSTTLRRGSRNKDQCRARCSPGHVSRTGLAPCYPCPLNTFQPEMGQVSCFKCPHEAMTTHPAAIAITDCLVGGLHLQNDDASAYQMQDDDQQELVDGIECFENPCRNGGTCIPNKLGIVTCNCAPGFKGLFCQTTVNECEAAPCLNGGTCFPRNDSYTCTCPPGFTGQKCERNVDECDSLPCQNGGICVDGSNSYTCTCKNGFQGVNCENNVNDCEDRPCLNGGTCEDDLGSFRCTCPLGYSGTTCEIEVDECLSMPCKNNGTCVDEPSIFRCVCSGGYTGQQCEVEILECDSSPCQNGGKCEDLINSYVCHCQDGHTGRNCESEVDEDYMLDFPTASTLNYALIPIERPLEAFTVAFWVKTNSSGSPDIYGTPFSYAVAGSDNALTLVDTSGFAFYVNQESKVTDVTVEDGLWHHVAVSWSSNRGNWKIYLDGLLTDSGFDLSTSKPVPGKGVLVIGQEQDTMGGGFSTNEALVGSLTLFNIWDEELPLADIESMRTSCDIKPGNVVAWSAVKAAMRGTLRSKPSPFCKDCPVPVAKDFGSVNYTSLAPGGIATFQCARGFLFSSQPTSTCLVTSMWESDPPVCTQIECGRPGSIPNGYIEGVKFSFDNRVRFHCNKGYKLQGQETLYCNEYGEWEGEKPACVEITCTLPLLSENTVLITQKQRFKPGESANFRCTPGNKLLTLHSQVTCQRDGTWDRSVPTCDPQKCSSPPSISFGQANTSSQNFNVGEIVRYICNIGYTLNTQGPNPSGAVTCLPTGEWERTLPECKIISCGEPPLVAHANTDGANRTFLSQIKYECQPGYAMQGHNKIECLEKGQWDPAPPRCLPVDCGPPPDLPRGQVEGTDFTYNAVVVSSCDPGHKILGEARRRCNESGQWEGVDPVCKPVSCGRPSAPANGKVFAPVITFQAQATYECVEGYTLQGVAFRECGEDGQWREAEPECTPVNCGPVIETENGTFQAPSTYTFGARVVYTCQNGFNMEGESELICLSTGYWSYEAPVCVPVECPIPTKPAFGKIKLQSFTTYTSKVEYECDDGYVLDGPDTRTCEADGSWSEQEPVCLPVMCEPPPPIDNGRYDYKDLKIGSIVRYFCDANYAMQGNEIRRCLSNLTLSGTEPVCQLITCERPEIPENGFLTLPDPQVLVMGSVVSYSCQEGHVLKGASVLRCGSNGLFNGSAPSCPPVECDRPTQVISNGRMLGTNFTFKSVISYECNEGYRLIGAKQRICKSSGEWDQPIPVCSVVECPRLVISNGNISTFKRDYGAVVTVTCRTGYRLEGSAERRCLVSGVWSGNDSVCLKKCPQLPSLQNGRYQRINETLVTYVCNEGYNLKGTNSSKCNSSGLWDPVPPKCVRITCSDLSNATLENGRVEFSSAVSGSFVQYVCNRGYNLFGSNRRVCSIAGHWVGEIPTCQVVSCNATGNPLNGIVKGSNFTYGAELNYDCDQGFVLVGLARRVCQEDGQWSGEKPRCEIITCPGVETTLENGLVLTLSNTYGGTVQYSCNSGFALTGDNIRECLETGNWSSEAPICVSLECSAPLSSQHMQVKGTDYRVGQKVQYTCNPGFEPLGPIDTTCLLNLTWSNPPPICDRVKCPDIPPLQNGVIVGEGRRYGDGVLHVCLPGYELIGQTSRVCQANGSWTGRESKCSPVSCGPPPSVLNAVANLENGTLFLSVIGYECNAGYYTVGNITTTCLENANWSAINFTCKLVNCIPITKASFLNGSIQGELHSYGSEVGFICSEGFRLSGSNATVCKADGTWSNPVPSCHLVQCPEPQSIPNGHVTVSGYIFNSTAKYECEVGYQLNGNNVSTCMSDGLWSTDKRTCDKVTCQAPLDVIPHGLLLDRRDVYVYGDVVTYKCDSGYKTVGSELLACSANGDFVPTPPTCVKILCPPVVPPVQGSVRVDNDTLVYSCVQGFELFGLERRRCTDTGQWEGVSPVCNPILCPNPELILNGHLTGNDFVFGSSVTYRCDTGFRLAGSSVITCLANGTWNSATPVCQRISCGPPQAVLSGNVVGKSFFYNDSVLYECHNGFLLSGPNERICLENGNWSGPEPLCEEILCDPPPNIANAVHDANDDDTFNVGFVVMYTCDLGHINYNSSIIICEEDRTWSDPLPSCSPVSCPYIPPPDHGHVTGDDITFNSEVHISCSPGYRLSSNGILTCMAHGEWDQNVPLCLQIVCPFPEIEHGGMHLEGQSQNVSLPAVILPGQVVIFTCDPGYRIGGALLSQCLDTGGWTNSPPVCLQVVCSTPPFVTHALRQDIGEFHAGGQVIYTCDPGYNMEGDSTLTCGNDGEWQGKNPLCIDIFCELPPMVENATELTIGAAVGEWVQYSCADGFKLEDGHSGRLSCLEGGVWSAELPVCLPVTCGQPPTISNAFYLERVEYLAGDVVIYTCLPGYEMEGQDTLTCGYDEQWKGLRPSCVDKTCDLPPFVENASTVGAQAETAAGDFVEYMCTDGFQLADGHDGLVVCLPGGFWSTDLPLCLPVTCSNPPNISNAFYLTEIYRVGDKANYICYQGYQMEIHGNLTCGYNGQWVGQLPHCIDMTCNEPPLVENANVTEFHTERRVGNWVQYVCSVGFTLQDGHDGRLFCLEGGIWSDRLPNCVHIDCGPPLAPIHARVKYTSTTAGSRANVTCDEGHQLLQGLQVMEIVCDISSTWADVERARCTPVVCGQPPAIAHTLPLANINTVFGSNITYHCIAGYVSTENATLFCSHNGSWTGHVPSCEPITCGPPEINASVQVIGSEFTLGSVLSLGCQDGLRLVGPSSITCQENGQWSSQTGHCEDFSTTVSGNNIILRADFQPCPIGYLRQGDLTSLNVDYQPPINGSCVRVSCGPPPVPDESAVKVFGRSYLYGDQVMFLCRPGLSPTRMPPTLTCTDTGHWDGEAACSAQCKLECQHGGRCVAFNRCKCLPGYTGTHCQLPICILPCLNGGTCSGPYGCTCQPGYFGSRCHKAICSRPCQNGGRCLHPDVCQCFNGFKPPFCESNYSLSVSKPLS